MLCDMSRFLYCFGNGAGVGAVPARFFLVVRPHERWMQCRSLQPVPGLALSSHGWLWGSQLNARLLSNDRSCRCTENVSVDGKLDLHLPGHLFSDCQTVVSSPVVCVVADSVWCDMTNSVAWYGVVWQCDRSPVSVALCGAHSLVFGTPSVQVVPPPAPTVTAPPAPTVTTHQQ